MPCTCVVATSYFLVFRRSFFLRFRSLCLFILARLFLSVLLIHNRALSITPRSDELVIEDTIHFGENEGGITMPLEQDVSMHRREWKPTEGVIGMLLSWNDELATMPGLVTVADILLVEERQNKHRWRIERCLVTARCKDNILCRQWDRLSSDAH